MICFAWSGFPQYAARCVGAFVKTTAERVVVVGTRPDVPIEGMEQCCGCDVYWIERTDTRPLATIVGELPRLIILSGWAIPAFNRYRDEVHLVGGKVVAMCDNNFVLTFKEILRAIRFRLLFRGKYDAYFVPGKNGVKLLRFYGVPREKIYTGMYAADSAVFKPGKPLAERPKKIIYVGRFNERKNVLRLVRAFQKVGRPEWTLELYGSGPLKDALLELVKNSSNITINDFLQPEELAGKYRESRVFILPSVLEHWGLVVHEAALSGCVLLLGENIGAADDFLKEGKNGWSFDPVDVDDIGEVIKKAIEIEESRLKEVMQIDVKLAGEISTVKFLASICKMSENLQK